MSTINDVLRGWQPRLQVARDQVAQDPGLAGAGAGAVLLMLAPVLPGFARLVVLPALLLAPGVCVARLLRARRGHARVHPDGGAGIARGAGPSSSSLVLDVIRIGLSPVSLGLLLGVITALFLAGSYGRQLLTGPLGQHWRTPSGDRELPDETTLSEPR